MRRLTTVLAAAALLCALVPAAAQARAPRGFVGLAAEDVFAGDANYRTSNLSAQAAIGVGLIRQTFDWRTIETSPGRYDLRYHDAYVAKLAAHGVRVLPILFNAPSFRSGTTRTRPTYPPRSNSSMASFARVLVRRYGPSGSLWRERPGIPKVPITAWQIWNEPNLPVYWRGRPSARAYAAMLRTVGGAIKRTHRRAEIVSAGLPPSRLRGAVPLSRYIAQLYRARIGRTISSLAINSYATSDRDLARMLRSIRSLMNRRGGRRDKIWITEIGWATAGPRSRFRVGTRGQARRIDRAYRFIGRNRRRLNLRGVVYFSWRDLRPYAPAFRDMWGLHAGLLRLDGSFKPGYYSFKKAISRIR
jgi:hypothetical protein